MKTRLLAGSLLAAVLAVAVAVPVFAGGLILDSKDGVATVAQETVVEGSTFVVGESIEINGTVQGDLFCAGGDVVIRGTVEGDVLCAANTVSVGGIVKGDARVAGSTVSIDGAVDGAVTVAGATVTVAKEAKIGTDATVWGSTLRVDGTVGRDLKGGGSTVAIGGIVGRDVDVSAERVSVGDGAKINGNLTYEAENSPAIAEGSVVGSTTRTAFEQSERFGSSKMAFSALVIGALATIVFMTVLTLVIVLLVPRYVREATRVDWQGFFFATLIGILTFAVLLPLLILSFVSVVGLLVGVLLLVAFGLASLLAGPLVAYYIGAWVMEGRSRNMLVAALVGAILVGIVSAIPLVGFLVALLVYFAGIGLVVLSVRAQYSGGYTVEVPVSVATPATVSDTPPAAEPVRKKKK